MGKHLKRHEHEKWERGNHLQCNSPSEVEYVRAASAWKSKQLRQREWVLKWYWCERVSRKVCAVTFLASWNWWPRRMRKGRGGGKRNISDGGGKLRKHVEESNQTWAGDIRYFQGKHLQPVGVLWYGCKSRLTLARLVIRSPWGSAPSIEMRGKVRVDSLSHLYNKLTSKWELVHRDGFSCRHDPAVAPGRLHAATDLIMRSHGHR